MLGMVKDWFIRFKRDAAERNLNVNIKDFSKLIVIKILANNTIADYLDKKLYNDKEFVKYIFHLRSNRKTWNEVMKKYKSDETFLWSVYHRIDYLFCIFLYPGINIVDYFRYEFYNFSHYKRKQFITEGYLKKLDRRFNGGLDNNSIAVSVLSDKHLFNKKFSDFVHRKWIISDNLTKEDFHIFCKELSEVIVKPLNGIQGKGIYKANVKDDSDIDVIYNEIISSKFIIEEVIKQHPDISLINSTSINTVRIFTVKKCNGDIIVSDAAFRVGRFGKSTDNYHAGGIAFALDRDTGMVISRGIDENANSYYVHPDSNITMLGLRIPYWENVKKTCIEAHKKIFQLGYIGWDVVILEDGNIELIEGNTFAGVTDLYQAPSLDGRKKAYDDFLK